MTIEPEQMNVKLLGIGNRKTLYRCEFCGALTDGITSHKGFICCPDCKERNIQ